MTAGLPGTGLGGVFYLVSALWMPISELAMIARGQRREGKLRQALVQAGIAVGVIAGTILSGWLAEMVIPARPGAVQMPLLERMGWFLMGSIGVLTVVWVGIHVLRFTIGRKKTEMHMAYNHVEVVPVEVNS